MFEAVGLLILEHSVGHIYYQLYHRDYNDCYTT